MLLLDLNAWWADMDTTEHTFWSISLIATLLLVVQTLVSLVGIDSDAPEFEHGDIGGDGFSALSLRGILAFLTFFGWTALIVLEKNGQFWLALPIAVVAGLAAMFAVAYAMFALQKLDQSGNVDVAQAIGASGEVYLPIPAQRLGQGKVHLRLGGGLREMDAVTDGPLLHTGAPVRISALLTDNLLLVEALEE